MFVTTDDKTSLPNRRHNHAIFNVIKYTSTEIQPAVIKIS